MAPTTISRGVHVHYGFKNGFRARAVKADVVAAELERIKEENGALTAEDVFESARPKTAPLHAEFEWDGKAAVRELGLIRARSLIRAVVVVKEQPEEAPRRVWVHVGEEGKPNKPGEYERVDVVVQNVDLFERALTDLQRKFDAASEALAELRRAAEDGGQPDRLAAISLAVQGFGAVREALAVLR